MPWGLKWVQESILALCGRDQRVLCLFTNPNNPSESAVNQAHGGSVLDTRCGNDLIYLLDVLKAFHWSESTWLHGENTLPALGRDAAGIAWSHRNTHRQGLDTASEEAVEGAFGMSKSKVNYSHPSLTVISFIQKLTILPECNMLHPFSTRVVPWPDLDQTWSWRWWDFSRCFMDSHTF